MFDVDLPASGDGELPASGDGELPASGDALVAFKRAIQIPEEGFGRANVALFYRNPLGPLTHPGGAEAIILNFGVILNVR